MHVQAWVDCAWRRVLLIARVLPGLLEVWLWGCTCYALCGVLDRVLVVNVYDVFEIVSLRCTGLLRVGIHLRNTRLRRWL